jgi:ubiquinone/menaquinone biosynthesis C-methylase UbiE
MPWWAWLIGAGAVIALGYWLLVLTEGTYLGPRVVVALYDGFARRYDQVKQFDQADEAFFLGAPMARLLASVDPNPAHVPALLDVASGTGRLPAAVLQATPGQVRVVSLDRSGGMLAQARKKLQAEGRTGVAYLQADANPLPFCDGRFDGVACLEALEFMPQPRQVLAELLRVLRPGGFLAVTNRIGWQARLMPGKTFARSTMVDTLRSLGATSVQIQPWQVDYDLVLARKLGPIGRGDAGSSWKAWLCCPRCQAAVVEKAGLSDVLQCPDCGWRLENHGDIWQAI